MQCLDRGNPQDAQRLDGFVNGDFADIEAEELRLECKFQQGGHWLLPASEENGRSFRMPYRERRPQRCNRHQTPNAQPGNDPGMVREQG